MHKYTKHILLTIFASLAIATPSYAQEQNENIEVIDLSKNHWAQEEITKLLSSNVLEVDPDLHFRPYANMTVKEAQGAVQRAFHIPNMMMKDKTEQYFHNRVMTNISNELLTVKELQKQIIQAYLLYTYNSPSNIKVINNIIMSTNDDLNHYLTRAEFASILYKTLEEVGLIADFETPRLENVTFLKGVSSQTTPMYFEKVNSDTTEDLFIKASQNLTFIGEEKKDYGFAIDEQYSYALGMSGSKVTITIRTFENGDYFIFSRFDNLTNVHQEVDLIQVEENVNKNTLYRYDRYPIQRDDETVFGQDITSYPTGLLQIVKDDGSIEEQMVGKAYESQQLTLSYEDGGKSQMRSLQKEFESLSYAQVGDKFVSINKLESDGKDIVEQWVMNSDQTLFNTDVNRENWMQETAEYYIKRNNWYTAEGPLNKMATSTEPLPESGHGYGRNLLLVKEDRALVLYKQQGDRYFENLVHNSFVNLEIFKGNQTYWPTEVTSTYLKGLYHITAPFIDTRFNEQIALFYYNSGKLFDVKNYKEPLRNYADLLVSQKEKGNVIFVDDESFYISDYFPIVQDATTHSSMNHVLGGMNLLLMAYQEFGEDQYLDTARAIMTAIKKDQHKWIRENGDIWYKVNADGSRVGDDYQHLTLEDLINAYKLWSKIDSSYLETIEELIASKSSYLSNESLGYTTKIYNGLKDIGMLHYLPKGEERTDAK